VEPKAWQPKLFRQHHNVEPGQHSGRLLDKLRAHTTAVVFLVEDFQTAMLKTADLRRTYIVTIVSCQQTRPAGSLILSRAGPRRESGESGVDRLAPAPRPYYVRPMCGRVRLSSDVSEIKLRQPAVLFVLLALVGCAQ